jgi:hypothetical protein
VAKSWTVKHSCGHRYRWTSLIPGVRSVRRELEPMIDAALTGTPCPACGGETGVFHPQGKVTFHHRGVPIMEGEPLDPGSRLILPDGVKRPVPESAGPGPGSPIGGIEVSRG